MILAQHLNAEAIPGAIENLARRDMFSKTFNNPDGSTTLTKTGSAIHYRAAGESDWHECDFSLVLEADKWCVRKAPYDVEIDTKTISYRYSSKLGGIVNVRLAAIDSVPVEQLNLNLSPRLDGNKIVWENVLVDLDIWIAIKSLGVESFKLLKTNKAPVKFDWEIIKQQDAAITIQEKSRGVDAYGLDLKGRTVRLLHSTSNRIIDGGNERYTISEEFTKEVVGIKDVATRIKSWGTDVNYPVLVDATVSENITVGADDGTESLTRTGGATTSTSWNAVQSMLAVDFVGTASTNSEQHIGLRFQTIGVPQGSTINSATLKLHRGNGDSGSLPKTVVWGDDVNDAASWSASNRPSQINKTTANVAFTPSTGTGLKTIAITGIADEIIGRTGWASGDIRFAILNAETSVTISASMGASFAALEHTADPAPLLTINYTSGGGGGGLGPGQKLIVVM